LKIFFSRYADDVVSLNGGILERLREDKMIDFVKRQEERLALRLLKWHYQRNNIPKPPEKELEIRSVQLVEDAHRIARERGKNMLSILKELIENLKQK
jgi:hypothetical protein